MAVLLLGTRAALAQDATAGAVMAYDQGEALMAQGRISEACPRYAESQRLDPQLGTLLHLAECLERNGQTASAWAKFREATELAEQKGDPRQEVAKQRADALAPRLSRLTIHVAPTPNVQVERDAVAIGRPLWGTPVPTDPGLHRITASAPGHRLWSGLVEVKADGSTAAISVPVLQAEGAPVVAAVAAPAAAAPPPEQPPAPPPPKEEASSDQQNHPGKVVIGLHIGVKLAGGGDLTSTCTPTGEGCGETSVSVDDESPVTLAAEVLFHVTRGLRLGAGYWAVPYAAFKGENASETFHFGSEHRLVGVVEGIAPLSQHVALAFRAQGGVTMLLADGDLVDLHDSGLARCQAVSANITCTSSDGPFFGGNYGVMAGLLVGKAARFRGDFALDFFSYKITSAEASAPGQVSGQLEEKVSGTRFFLLAGLEL